MASQERGSRREIPKVNYPTRNESLVYSSPNRSTGAGIPQMNRPTDMAPVEYNHDYFSGSTIRVFFENIWVDDVITLQFNASQQKTPIYGYASQFFNAVANGTFIIQGTFAIAFKESGYLYTILNKLKDKNNDADVAQAVKDAKRDNARLARLTTASPAYGRVANTTKIDYLTIENWLGTDSAGVSNFENIAESLEDVLWGVDDYDKLAGSNNPGPIRKQNRIPRADELDRKENPFKVGRIGDGYDIIITYGDINDGPANHTVKTLSGIHITGSSQTLAPTGEPVVEVYSFFARSLDDRITKRTEL